MVKSGYKETEIGVIPEEWKVCQVREIVESYMTGGNYSNSIEISPYPLIKMGNIARGSITLEKLEFIQGNIPNPRDRLEWGDVLFNTRNTPELVGKVAIWRRELPNAYFNLNLLRFNFRKDKIDPFFFNLVFNTKEIIAKLKNIAKGTTSVAAIYPNDLLKIEIQCPCLEEQQKIAGALSDMDELIASLEKLIAKKKAIKQGAMQELLTGKKRLPGFDEEWEESNLEGRIGFQVGFPFASQYFNTQGRGLRLIKNRDLKTDDQVFFTTEKFGTEYIVNNGDILVGMDGDFLPCYWKKGAALLNQRVGRLFCKESISLLFLYYALQKPLLELQNGTGATTVKHLSHKDIEKVKLFFPKSVNEQHSIASILSDMDAEIEALEQKLAKCRQVKQGMMQQLLTGKIRLV